MTEDIFAENKGSGARVGAPLRGKRIQDVEEELSRLQEFKLGDSQESQVEKFRRLVLTFKDKYQQALQELSKKDQSHPLGGAHIVKKYQDVQEENASLIAQQASLKQMLLQTQQKLGFALETVSETDRWREMEEESSKLKAKLHATEAEVVHLVRENRQYRQQLDASGGNDALVAAEARCQTLEREKKELAEKVWLTKEELNRAKGSLARGDTGSEGQGELAHQVLTESQQHNAQLERAVVHLRASAQAAQVDVKTMEQELHGATSQVEALNAEITRLQKSVEEYNLYLGESEKQKDDLTQELKKAREQQYQTASQRETYETELAAMKETMVQGLRETKEIKQHYHNLASEKAASIQKNRQMQQHHQELKAEIQRREAELQEVHQQVEEAGKERDTIEKHLHEERDKQNHFESKMRERDDNITSFSEQIKTMQHKLRKAEAFAQEKERAIVEAQQHMAKKVKEVADLKEKFDHQTRQNTKLQEDLIEAKAKVAASLTKIETYLESQRKVQEQLDAKEEKYQRNYERLLEYEAQNKELRKVQEKHEQMQQLLANLGNVIGSPVGFNPQPTQETPVEGPPPKPANREEQMTLFDKPKPPKPFKNTMFD